MTVLEFLRRGDLADVRLVRAILVYAAWHGGEAPHAGQLHDFAANLYREPVAPNQEAVFSLLCNLRRRGMVRLSRQKLRKGDRTTVTVTDLGRAWQRGRP